MVKNTLKLKILRKIIFMNLFMVFAIVFSLASIFSLFSSMSGLANAIDDSGSERMRSILLGSLGTSYIQALENGSSSESDKLKKLITDEIEVYDKILTELQEEANDPETINLINIWSTRWLPFKQALERIIVRDKSISELKSDLSAIQVLNAIDLKNKVQPVVLSLTRISNGKLLSIQKLLILIIVIILFLGLVSIFLLRKSLIPMGSLINVMHLLQEKDLTVRSNINRNDEVGKISNTLNEMIAVFDKLIGDMRLTANSVELANGDLASSIVESVTAVREMVATIESVNSSLNKQHDLVEFNVASVNKQKEQTKEIASLVQDQSMAVQESSANIEEMVASIKSVNISTSKARELSQGLSETANSGWDKIEATIIAIDEIKKAAESVQESVVGITNIASTTNLLSMNAAIEAAHAGAAGSGFAVVADEINKLAASSAEEAKNITKIMKETMNFIEKGTTLSSDAGTAFQAILTDIQQTVDIILNIASSMDEQSLGATDILSSINLLVELSLNISEITEKGEKNAESLLISIQNVKQLSREISNASNEQKIGGSELLESMNLLQDVSERNRESVDILNSKINVFKVTQTYNKLPPK